MKVAASLVAVALAASPTFAQTIHVHSSTREIHATNVPVHRETQHYTTRHHVRHHVVRCKHVTRHGKTYCAKSHHLVVKKTVTTTSTHS